MSETKIEAFRPEAKRHPGTAILLPENLTYEQARKWLADIEAEESRTVDVVHIFESYPLDALACFQDALTELFGFTKQIDGIEINIPTSYTTSRSVPYGEFSVMGIDGMLRTQIPMFSRVPKLQISGSIKVRSKPAFNRLIELTEQRIRQKSIYRGKAIRVDFEWLRKGQAFNPINNAPSFLDTTSIDPTALIFPKITQDAIDIGLNTLLQHTNWCRANNIPLRTGILAAGPYGCGKTMLADVTARIATDNNWTFIYLKNVVDLAEAYTLAKKYAPAVIFAEDVDRATSGDRTQELDKILNTIDGVDSKRDEIICIFTTNHVENINQAMIRPGRIDTVIEVTAPDAETAIRLVQRYGGSSLEPNLDLTNVGQRLAGLIPASIRTVVEKAKRAALLRAGPEASVNAGDLIKAANAMTNHLDLLKPRPVNDTPTIDKLIANTVRDVLDEQAEPQNPVA